MLDESRPLGTDTDGDNDPAGLATTTVSFAGNFAAADYGADGPGSTVYSLSLIGTGVPSGLYALGADGAQGAQILLNQSGNVITGSIGSTIYFTITVNPANGEITFAQTNNVWHADTTSDDDTSTLTLSNANLLQLVQTVTDADNDFDTAAINLGTGVFKIEDDGPKAVTNASVPASVDEDGLSVHGQDSGKPGEVTGTGSASVVGAAGALNAVIDFGTDGPHPTEAFALDVVAVPESTGLKSQGVDILIVSDGVTLTGYVEQGGSDRPVFTLTVGANGGYTFTLLDQIDHPALDGVTGDNGENLLGTTIDLSAYIVAKDGDGDTVSLAPGAFAVQVLDDVPVLTNAPAVTMKVDEDDIETVGWTPGQPGSTGSAPDDGDGDGSFTGTPGVDTQGPANATSAVGNLLSLVAASGADDPLAFGFVSDANARAALLAQNLTSQGGGLSYQVVGNILYGFVDDTAPPANQLVYNQGEDRLVFTLEITNTATGEFKFSLYDQLDHAPGQGQNSLPIHFGAALQATDFDGDSIPLTGKVTVNVTDDVPVLTDAAPVTLTVDEDDIETAGSTGSAPDDGDAVDGSFTGQPGVDTQGPANATSGSLAGLVVASGADDPLSFGFVSEADVRAFLTAQNLTSEGEVLSYDLSADGTTLYGFVNAGAPGVIYNAGQDRLVFELEVDPATGAFTFALHDQLDHAPGQGQNSLAIDFGGALQATDFDGDSIPLTGKVTVNVTDDVPVLTGRSEAQDRQRGRHRHPLVRGHQPARQQCDRSGK